MGGSVIVHACPLLLDKKYRLTGVAVLDVVEGKSNYIRNPFLANIISGSALEALPHMHNLLNARPDGFDSIEEAVEWQ